MPRYLAAALLVCLASVGHQSLPAQTPAPSTPQPVDMLTGSRAGQERETVLPDEVKLKLVWRPPGSFKMGEGSGAVDVRLTHGYWLGQTEVTQGQWRAVMESEPWKGESFVREGAAYPATYVGFDKAIEFCRKLTASERQAGRLPADWEYTLPTEAQWESACRAGTTTVYSFGDDESRLGDYAWCATNTWDIGEKHPHRVGLKQANPWGLYDMHGNVWEWCRDWYQEELPGGVNPVVTAATTLRVNRGGGWFGVTTYCRSGYHNGDLPHYFDSNRGFRVALVPAGG